MSQQQPRDNSGILFTNGRKERDNQPDFKGRCTIGGVEYWVSGWEKVGQKGPFTSLAFEIKEDKPQAPPARTGQPRQAQQAPSRAPQRQAPQQARAAVSPDDFDESQPIPF